MGYISLLRYWVICMVITIGLVAVCYGWSAMAQPVTDIERRLSVLEAVDIASRLAVLEQRMNGLDTIGRGILIAVAAQLLVSGFQLHSQRRSRQ